MKGKSTLVIALQIHMTKKRFLCYALLLSMLFSTLASCKGNTDQNADSTPSQTTHDMVSSLSCDTTTFFPESDKTTEATHLSSTKQTTCATTITPDESTVPLQTAAVITTKLIDTTIAFLTTSKVQVSTTKKPETNAPVTTTKTPVITTKTPETTHAPVTTKMPETTKAPVTTKALTTTAKKEETKPLTTSEYPMTYSDKTGSISIDKVWYGSESTGAWCYVAKLEFTDYDRFYSINAFGKYNSGHETIVAAYKREKPIFMVNGDYANISLDRTVVRDGKVCHDAKFSSAYGVYNANTGILTSAKDAGLYHVLASDAVKQGLVTDTMCFCGYIVKDGKPDGMATIEDHGLTRDSRAQRTFIGTDGQPGHLIIVVSEGRYQDGVSAGLTYPEMADLLIEYGCTFGIPLDGGGSSRMVFQGKILNTQATERPVLDFFCFK